MKKKPRLPKASPKAPKVITYEAEYRPLEEQEEEPDGLEDPEIASQFDTTNENEHLPAVNAVADSSLKDLPEKTFPQNDLLKNYLKAMSKYELLTPEQELELANRLKQTGDLDAAKQLVRANLRLVVKIAMEYRSAYQNVLDLIQEGNIGLMKAVSKFDPAKGAKLSYYANWWIRSYILKYILDNFRLVKVGTTQAQKKLFFHLMREKDRLEAQGLDAGPKLLADHFNVREEDIVEMENRLGSTGNELSLNRPMGASSSEAGDGNASYQDLMPDSHDLQDETLSSEELKEILTSHLGEFEKLLKDKEKAIFKERLAAESPKTLQEVADQFGLTRERVRQIEVKVIEKLREFYKQYL